MKKVISFLSLCALVALLSGCVITPKDTKGTAAPEAVPSAAVVEEKAVAEEVAEPAEEAVTEEKLDEVTEEESAPAEEPETEEPEEVSEPAEEPAEEPEEVAEPAEESASLPEVCLDFPENVTLLNEPFGIVGEYGEGAGQATLTGTVKTATADFFGNNFEYVYFMISDSSSDFYKYFKGMVDGGNTVNVAEGEVLGFTLGVLEDGKLSTTSLVLQSAQDKILGALNSGEEISLKLGVPKYEGKGASYNFSFACVIE